MQANNGRQPSDDRQMVPLELGMSYFKQGDDFRHHLEDHEGDVLPALQDYRDHMQGMAEFLDTVQEIVSDLDEPIEAWGDTHWIRFTLSLKARRKIAEAVQDRDGIAIDWPEDPYDPQLYFSPE